STSMRRTSRGRPSSVPPARGRERAAEGRAHCGRSGGVQGGLDASASRLARAPRRRLSRRDPTLPSAARHAVVGGRTEEGGGCGQNQARPGYARRYADAGADPYRRRVQVPEGTLRTPYLIPALSTSVNEAEQCKHAIGERVCGT